MLKKYCFDWVNLSSNIKYNPQFSWKLEMDTQFLSGERFVGLQKLMCPKGHSVNKAKKLYIEIGLQKLQLKEAKEGKTKNGYPKVTVSFYKPPEKHTIDDKEFTSSLGNNTDTAYSTIDCTHVLKNKSTGDFKSMWFRPFTNCFTREDFKRLPKGAELKCIVIHQEEYFIVNGKRLLHERGSKFGEEIIMIKPEVVTVYHIDTPDEDIKINYLKLYKPLKK